MGSLSGTSKIVILTIATAITVYLYAPQGKNYIRMTKYIKTMPKPQTK